MKVIPRNIQIDTDTIVIIHDVFHGDIWIAAFGNEEDAKAFIAMKEAQEEQDKDNHPYSGPKL